METAKGNRVRLEVLEGDIFEGYIHSVDQNVGKITLQKVTLCGIENKKKLQGLLHFHNKEIKEIEVFEDVDSSLRPRNSTAEREPGPLLRRCKEPPRHTQNWSPFKSEDLITRTSDLTRHEGFGRYTRSDTAGSLKSSDYDSSSDVGDGSGYRDFRVIDKMDQVFCEAIDCIRGHTVIAVGLEGVDLGRDGKLCWLQFATKEDIFLFDVLSLGSACFHQGLQDILESSQILKVMHDCRQPSDILYHQFGVELVNIFDTQVAAVFTYRMKHHGDYPRYVESQHSLLVEFLDIDLNDIHILRYRERHKKEDQEIWCQRPAPLNILTAASKQVKHLLPLRVVMMENLLKEVNVGTDIFLGYVRDASAEDSKRGLSTRHLLPHAFQHLNTHVDFLRHTYHRPARMYSAGPQKDNHGFDENCRGVIDPYIVASSDSIWHHRKNYNSPAFRRRSEGDRALKSSAGISKEAKSLPSSPGNSMVKSSPIKHGHCVSRGPSEVRRPASITTASSNSDDTSTTIMSLSMKNIPEVSESAPKSKHQVAVEESIEYKPAGYFQNDLGKRRRNYHHCEDSDLENPIQIGDYSCPEETEFEDSFSCIPSRESLGRNYIYEYKGSIRDSIETITNGENRSVGASVHDNDSVNEQLVSANPTLSELQDDEQDVQKLLQNRRYHNSPFNSGSDSETCLSSLPNVHTKSPPAPGMGRGICKFLIPSSPQSSGSSESLGRRPAMSSVMSPQELLECYLNPKPGIQPSTSMPDSGDKNILQSMVNSDSAGSSPYGRQMSLLRSLSSAKKTSSSGSSNNSSPLSDNASVLSSASEHCLTSKGGHKKSNGQTVTFDSLLKQISSGQY